MWKLTVLFFSSILYLTLADPIPEPKTPTSSPAAPTPDSIKNAVDALVAEIQQSLDTHLTPIMSQLDPDTQQFVMKTADDIIFQYLNFLLYILYPEIDPQAVPAFKNDDVIVQFESPKNFVAGIPNKSTAAGNN